jgi:hypothetical protein
MSETTAPRNTPAPDGRRWQADGGSALLCVHCRGTHNARPGVTWTNSRWIVDWVCPACGTAASSEATDTEIWDWADTIGPWATTPGTGGSGRLLT